MLNKTAQTFINYYDSIYLLEINLKSGHLTCPYSQCKKDFEKPVMLTDFSKTPRETYYACPHCLTRVDVVAKDSGLDSISVEGSENALENSPKECRFRFGYLKTLRRGAAFPDECFVWSKLLQCSVKRE